MELEFPPYDGHLCLMRLAGIQGVSRKKGFTVTTRRGNAKQVIPDLVQRQFVANELWVTIMAYLLTWQDFIYLAVAINVYSRKIVGWLFSQSMTSQVVMDALNMAFLTGRSSHVIYHSDQGSLYTSVASKWESDLQLAVQVMHMTMPWLRFAVQCVLSLLAVAYRKLERLAIPP